MRCLVAVASCRDSVEWSDDLQQSAVQSVRENSAEQLAQDVAGKTVRCLFFLAGFLTVSRCSAAQYEAEASIHWDSFYQQHQNRSGGRGRLMFKEQHEKQPRFQALFGSLNGSGNEATSHFFKDGLQC